jgi:hypothetical protein
MAFAAEGKMSALRTALIKGRVTISLALKEAGLAAMSDASPVRAALTGLCVSPVVEVVLEEVVLVEGKHSAEQASVSHPQPPSSQPPSPSSPPGCPPASPRE